MGANPKLLDFSDHRRENKFVSVEVDVTMRHRSCQNV